VEVRLRARIAALAEAEPALADDLALRGALIEIVDRAETGPFELRLPADLVRARLAAGVPLLDRLDLPIPPSTAALFERLTAAMLAAPDTREPAEALLVALRSHRLHAEQLVGEAIVGHDDHLAALAASAGIAEKLVILVADLASRAVLADVARRLRPALALGAWDRAYCPMCGGLPILAERSLPVEIASSPSPAHGGGGRGIGDILRCGRCATAWAHTLQQCPDCTTGAFGVVHTEEGGWRLAACDACPAYLKISASPRAERLGELLADDLETWSLDRWALEHGLQRRGVPGYRLEHGEPPGEELDDD